MKKSFIVLATMIITTSLFSQKIDYKKGVVTMDGKEVVYVNKKNTEYDISNTNSSPVLMHVESYTIKMNPDDLGKKIFKISNADRSKSVDIYPIKMKVFKPELAMMEDFIMDHKIVDENGVNVQNLDKFLDDNKNNVPKEIAAFNEKRIRDSLIEINRLFLSPNLTIQNKSKETVGKIVKAYENDNFKVYDLDNFEVAVGVLDERNRNIIMGFNNGVQNTYPFPSNLGRGIMQPTDLEILYRFMLEELSLNNIELGHATKEKKTIEKSRQIAEARKNSNNLYDVDGYYITEDGQKIKGKINFVAEEIAEEKTAENIYSISSNTGKFAGIDYTNEKGKTKHISIKASSNDSFVVIDNGKEVKYYGMKPKSSVGMLEKATFYTVAIDAGKVKLYQSPSNDNIVLKTSNQEEGIVLNDRKNEKISEKLAEYLSDCPSLAEEVKSGKYKLVNKEDVKTVITKYNSCN